jgi:hypothetical protein
VYLCANKKRREQIGLGISGHLFQNENISPVNPIEVSDNFTQKLKVV